MHYKLEGSEIDSNSDGTKIIVGTWLLSTFVIMASYGSTLTAMITVPKVVILIDSVEDLLHQDRYTWKLEDQSSTYTYFQASNLL